MSQSTDKPAQILVVEDSREVLAVLERILSANGYTVRTARDGDAGLAMALDMNPDLVILDIGLPTVSGLQVAVELRNRSFRSPVLMLTARDTVSDKVTGLDAGADDYLAKPFDYDELLARVKALLRRASLRAGEAVMRVGDLTLDPISREVVRNGRPISLTPKEYALLEFLMKNAGRELSREQITEQVWKQDYDPSTNIVDVYVNYLRKKIEDGDQQPLLHTVRGIGYVLRA
jgi:two-component system response regulator MprA